MARVDEARIVSRYESGDPVRAIATEESVSLQTIYDVLDRRGVKTRREVVAGLGEQLAATAKEVGVTRAAEALGISARTGGRVLRAMRKRGESVVLRRGRPPEGTPEDQIVRRLRKTAFPYPPPLDKDQTCVELDRLRRVSMHLDGDAIRPRSNAGLRLCYPHFPNRYEARSGKNLSAVEAWHDERKLRRAVRLQIAYGDPTTPPRVLRAITLDCRTPTVFRPAVAKFICERYAEPGQVAWDPCSGYGGRLLGAHAAGVRYVGTDVDATTVDGNRRLAEAIASDAEVILCPAEDFDPPEASLVFTSPPYFDRERYSNDAAQSWRRHATVESWVTGFLRPVVARAWECLRAGGRLVLNVADIRARGKSVPIVTETVRAATSIGFHHVETLQMPIAGINRRDPSEPILIFRK